MTNQTVAEVHRLYDLGTPLAHPEQVFGGLLHQMYRFRATRGEFAVKRLNPVVMQYTDVRAKFRLSERIASTIASAGIPAVTALPSLNGDVLQDIGDDSVMVYPWIDALPSPASPTSAGPARSRQIGNLLGRIHALPLHLPELPLPSDSPVGDADGESEEWRALVNEAKKIDLPVAQDLRALLPRIEEWAQAAEEARQALLTSQPAWVISHSDLDQKNVIWTEAHTPHLIDWEAAGYVQPAIEAVCGALDWSGQAVGNLDFVTFAAFLDGYRAVSPLSPQQAGYGLNAYCGNWCGWLKFNLQRAVGAVTNDIEEQALGKREVTNTLSLLRSASANLPLLRRQFAVL